MSNSSRRNLLVLTAAAGAVALAPAWSLAANTFRIVTYNIDSSDIGDNTNLTNVTTVLKGINEHHLNSNAQPFDVLGLQELLDTNNNTLTSTSLTTLVNNLNAIYPGTYAYEHTPDPTSGGTQFNGPSGLIYNTHTVQVTTPATVLGYSGTGADSIPRAPMRYLIHPIGYSSAADFYMYVSHYKSGSGTTNTNTRNSEATEIRADADALPASTHILYTGDHNFFGDSGEPAYQTLIAAGRGQAHDPASATQVWASDAAHVSILTESAKSVSFRDDAELTSAEVYNQSGVYNTPGLRLASAGVGTYIVFGNGSSPTVGAGGTAQPFGGSVNYATNKTLADLSNASTVLTALTNASDHLPVVADYAVIGLPQDHFYVGPASGTWNPAANWSVTDGGIGGAGVPLAGDNAIVDPTVNTTLTFDGTYSAAGLNALTVAGKSGALATLNQSANRMAVAGDLVLGAPALIPARKAVYNLSGGTLAVSGALQVNSSDTFTWSGGTLSAGCIELVADGKMTVTPRVGGVNRVLRTSGLSIDSGSGSALDLNNNDLVVQYGTSANPFTTIRGYVFTGYAAAPDPTKTGIISSTGQSAGNTILALIDNALVGAPDWPLGSGQTILANSVIGKYTYFGDMNFDGQVTSDDYGILDANFGTSPAPGIAWLKGDANLDGSITADDYGILDANFGAGAGNPLSPALSSMLLPAPARSTALVPEPALLALPLASLLVARRRRAST